MRVVDTLETERGGGIAVAPLVIGKDDFDGGVGCAKRPKAVEKSCLRHNDAAQQAAPRQNNADAACETAKFSSKGFGRFRDAEQVRQPATAGFTRRTRGDVREPGGVQVRRDVKPLRVLPRPAVRTTPVTTADVDVDAPRAGRKVRSDLGSRADLNSAFGYDSHLIHLSIE